MSAEEQKPLQADDERQAEEQPQQPLQPFPHNMMMHLQPQTTFPLNPFSMHGFTFPLTPQSTFSAGSLGFNTSLQSLNDTGYASAYGSHNSSGSFPFGFPGFSTEQFAAPSVSRPLSPPDVEQTTERGYYISGRMSLLNENKKYLISWPELQRRASAPESMNISTLNGIVRRAKGQSAGKLMKQQLQERGIKVAHGQRMSVAPNCFVPLAEGEAMNMADDFNLLLKRHWPKAELRKLLRQKAAPFLVPFMRSMRQSRQSGQPLNPAVVVQFLKTGCAKMAEILDDDQTLNAQRNPDAAWAMEGQRLFAGPLPVELQKQCWNFNMVTHNFGVPAAKAVFANLATHSKQTGGSPDAAQTTPFFPQPPSFLPA